MEKKKLANEESSNKQVNEPSFSVSCLISCCLASNVIRHLSLRTIPILESWVVNRKVEGDEGWKVKGDEGWKGEGRSYGWIVKGEKIERKGDTGVKSVNFWYNTPPGQFHSQLGPCGENCEFEKIPYSWSSILRVKSIRLFCFANFREVRGKGSTCLQIRRNFCSLRKFALSVRKNIQSKIRKNLKFNNGPRVPKIFFWS